MSTISHGWKQHATRWWTLTIPRIAKGWSLTLDDLSEVPGVQSVHVRKHDAMWFYDVTIAMHESAFESEPFRRLQDAFELNVPGRGLRLSPRPSLPATLRTLRPYQLSGVDWLVANGGGVLGDEMGVGKGLPNDAPVLTPRGYKPIGALVAGDEVCTTYGGRAAVRGVYPQGERAVYRVTLSDGSSLLADDQHLWSVVTATRKHRGADSRVLSTADMLRIGVKQPVNTRGDQHRRWFLPDVAPVAFDVQDTPIDPYLLGLVLGDASLQGMVRLHNSHAAVRDAALARHPQGVATDEHTLSLRGLFPHIRALGLAQCHAWEKFIPALYLLNDVDTRVQLLAGLLDTDAECRANGTVVYTTTSQRLADDVAFLVRSLGGVVSVSHRVPTYSYKGEKRAGRVAYSLNIRTRWNPFMYRTERVVRWKPSRCTRAIESIDYVGRMPTTCISVDATNQLFLADNVTPTHNTTTAMVAAEALRSALHANAPVLIVGPKFTRDVWRRELQAVFGPDTELFACEGRKPTPEQERAMSRTKWWFVHYQILDGWRPALTRPMHAHRPAVTILDEAHWLKNPLSKRTKAAMATALLATCRIVLTGTPIDNEVNDLWPLLTLASGAGSWGTYFSFAHRYTHHEKGTYGWSSVGTRRMPELHGRMEHVYLRRTVAQIGGEIPPLTREQLIVEPSGTMPRELKKWCGGQPEMALDRIRDALAGGHLGADTLAAITAWRKWTSETKMPSTVHLAASLLGEGEKVVIFTWQRQMAEDIAQGIRDSLERTDAVVLTIHGDIDQADRDASVARFQESSAPMAIVATIDSLKEGVTLHAARREIIHDLHWVPSTILQAEARISRLGQTRPCLSTWMIVENSVDAVIAKHLMAKAEVISEALLDARAENAFVEVGLKTSDASGGEFAQRILEGL